MNIIEKPSPTFVSRDGHAVDMLVLHYTGMRSAAEALERLCDASAEVSAHYMVDEDGTIYRLVSEDMRAWHAGVSAWRGQDNINQRSIGIEIVNLGHEFGYKPFPKVQMEAVAQLCKDILSRHPIPARNVVAHSDVAPSRKEDPGELFDWKWLAGKGIGLWQKPPSGYDFKWSDLLVYPLALSFLPWWSGRRSRDETIASGPLPSIGRTQAQLFQYGYNCPRTGVLDEATGKVILAFQRHFFPERLTGVWDRECAIRLASLLSMV